MTVKMVSVFQLISDIMSFYCSCMSLPNWYLCQ